MKAVILWLSSFSLLCIEAFVIRHWYQIVTIEMLKTSIFFLIENFTQILWMQNMVYNNYVMLYDNYMISSQWKVQIKVKSLMNMVNNRVQWAHTSEAFVRVCSNVQCIAATYFLNRRLLKSHNKFKQV